jgi:hypothetical protein
MVGTESVTDCCVWAILERNWIEEGVRDAAVSGHKSKKKCIVLCWPADHH